MKKYYVIVLMVLALGCKDSKKEQIVELPKIVVHEIPVLNLEEANRLSQLPLKCMEIEYPNKLGQTLGGDEDLLSPKTLHPAFYGCFDWHSAVHGHWSLVKLLKMFPDIDDAEAIKQRLLNSMSKENIITEVAFFEGEHNKSFERTYGWAWVLKLAEEVHSWDAPEARILEANLQPLTDLMVAKYLDFLPKLNYPIRSGEHPNTAFGLSFAYDYAVALNQTELKTLIEKRSRDFYFNDTDCPLTWEPSGFDFLSPCLEEAALMKRILSVEEFKIWLDSFMPHLKDPNFNWEPGKVTDRTDGKLVHLDGVNFSRAWSLNKIAEGLAEYNHLKNMANHHINYSLPSIVGDSYEGGHWLGTFAIYALNSVEHD